VYSTHHYIPFKICILIIKKPPGSNLGDKLVEKFAKARPWCDYSRDVIFLAVDEGGILRRSYFFTTKCGGSRGTFLIVKIAGKERAD